MQTVSISMTKKNNSGIRKRQPVWSCVSGILKVFFRKPKIVSLSGELPDRAIYVANHSAMFGPLMYNLHLPAEVAQWGAYPMLGSYKARYRYLKDVYFIQKRHKSKFTASILAFIEAFLSPFFYRGLRVLPSYNDTRFITTIRKSIQMLDNGISIIIYPEDSSDGYHEQPTEFFAGFVELARYYLHKHGQDVPICPVYYHSKKNVMVVGEPQHISDYLNRGLNRKQIAKQFCTHVNNLFVEHIQNKY